MTRDDLLSLIDEKHPHVRAPPIWLLASLEDPDRVIQCALSQTGIGRLELLEGARSQRVALGRADVPDQRLRGKAQQHDVGFEMVYADQRAEVLPGNPPQAVNSSPRMPDLGAARILVKIGD